MGKDNPSFHKEITEQTKAKLRITSKKVWKEWEELDELDAVRY